MHLFCNFTGESEHEKSCWLLETFLTSCLDAVSTDSFIMNHDAWLFFFSKNQANWQSVIETMKCTEETCKVIDFKSLNTYQNSLICL